MCGKPGPVTACRPFGVCAILLDVYKRQVLYNAASSSIAATLEAIETIGGDMSPLEQVLMSYMPGGLVQKGTVSLDQPK